MDQGPEPTEFSIEFDEPNPDPPEPVKDEDLLSLDTINQSSLNRLSLFSNKGLECRDMMLLLDFLDLNKQEIELAVRSFWGLDIFTHLHKELIDPLLHKKENFHG